jgi:Ca-activated chloride channel homolog
MIPVLLMLFSCSGEGDSEAPRDLYNLGSAELAGQSFESASEKLLSARDQAGGDAELRQHSAYNLALAHAGMAAGLEGEDPEGASGQYAQSVSWFQDALRLDPEDGDARVNLEVVLRRMQLLADRLNAGSDKLEARLDRLLEDCRSLRDQARMLSARIGSTGDSRDPSGYRRDFDALAVQARMLQAEASTALQLSTEEIGALEGKTEEERSDADFMRIAQLYSLEAHLGDGRSEIADGRRVLRRLDVDRALERLESAVQKLVRAREQLQEPLAVLQAVAQEEVQLLKQTTVLAQSRQAALQLRPEASEVPALPSWFDGGHLSGVQGGLGDRAGEVLDRFSNSAASAGGAEVEAEQAEMLALVQEALPPLQDARSLMEQAEGSLLTEQIGPALEAEYGAVDALSQAIERFADAKTLIDLAHGSQSGLLSLVSPSDTPDPSIPSMTEEERLAAVRSGLSDNQGRIDRLRGALVRAKEKQLAEQQQQGAPSPSDTGTPDPAAATEAVFADAEELREGISEALMDMDMALGEGGDLSLPAAKALEGLSELQILFFSIVEHIQALLESQSVTRDGTAAAATDDYDQMLGELALIVPVQGEHQSKAKSISGALQEQADAAGEGGDPERSEALGDAYVEVAMAMDYMEDAVRKMEEVRTEAGGMSHELEPAVELQQQAMESLAAALQALQPPQQQEGEQGEDQEQQVSKQQAERRLQAAREREAERAAERSRSQSQPEPVEKDW